mmetsp:Transcript_17291/g.25929  ORF Transcript_17291/g.25929 Transcript_17291/m.25929 type:complete len:614 (-) Transcript_17291:187-2028(-)
MGSPSRLLLLLCCIFSITASGSPRNREWKKVNAYHSENKISYNGKIYISQDDMPEVIHPSFFKRNKVNLLAEDEDRVSTGSAQFWIYVAICAGLVCLGGLMSGLTVGYFSIDELKLRLLAEGAGNNPEMQEYANRVKPVLHHHHLLLVTLLLTNAGAMEALPIFLDKLVPEWLAIVLSVTFVLFFGEVIPQAVCTKNPLKIGAKCAPIIRCFMFMTYPVSYPIAKLLDCILGEETQRTYFMRSELRALIGLHNQRKGGNLLIDEVTIMQGALGLKTTTAEDCMTPYNEVFTLSCKRTLDQATMAEILTTGHSRVPIYSDRSNNIVGMLLVKRLIVVDPDDCRPISQVIGYHLPIVLTANTNLLDALNKFQLGRSHMALVVKTIQDMDKLTLCMKDDSKHVPKNLEILGILTIEDVIEELIAEDIADESDITFATKEFQEDFKGVRKAVEKFKSLLKRAKARKNDRKGQNSNRSQLPIRIEMRDNIRRGSSLSHETEIEIPLTGVSDGDSKNSSQRRRQPVKRFHIRRMVSKLRANAILSRSTSKEAIGTDRLEKKRTRSASARKKRPEPRSMSRPTTDSGLVSDNFLDVNIPRVQVTDTKEQDNIRAPLLAQG